MSENENEKVPPIRPPSKIPEGKFMEYVLAVGTSWLIPGAGHWILGYRNQAILLVIGIMGAFWSGQALADFRAVNKTDHPIFFSAQVANGFSTLVSEKCWGEPKVTPRDSIDKTIAPHHSTGILFTTISGLLNALAVLHVADPRTWSAREQERKQEAG